MKALLLLAALPLAAQTVSQLEPSNVEISAVTYSGRDAVRIDAMAGAANGTSYATLKGVSFRNGTIEVELAGKPLAAAGADARGFIGIAFRKQNGSYEYVYVRPSNGRADDQVRRNHSTQYGSHPDYHFARLRKESPEKYESYVDLEPGVWMKYKLVVQGTTARLYMHGAPQPCLLVNDLKLGEREGGVALWVGPGTEGYFRGLKISPQ